MRVLSRLFRRRFLEELGRAYDGGQQQFFGDHATLADATAFADWLAPLRQCECVVYAKRPFAGPAAVLAYLSRYAHEIVKQGLHLSNCPNFRSHFLPSYTNPTLKERLAVVAV